MKTTLKLILGLVFVILVVNFLLENPWMKEKFVIHYFGYQSAPIYLPVIILGAMLLGALLTAAAMLVPQLRLKRELRQQVRRIRQMEEELNSLRNLPLMESGGSGEESIEQQKG